MGCGSHQHSWAKLELWRTPNLRTTYFHAFNTVLKCEPAFPGYEVVGLPPKANLVRRRPKTAVEVSSALSSSPGAQCLPPLGVRWGCLRRHLRN